MRRVLLGDHSGCSWRQGIRRKLQACRRLRPYLCAGYLSSTADIPHTVDLVTV